MQAKHKKNGDKTSPPRLPGDKAAWKNSQEEHFQPVLRDHLLLDRIPLIDSNP